MRTTALSIALSLSVATLGCLSLASKATAATPMEKPSKLPRPVVFHHGMGDSAHSKGMKSIFDSIQQIAPEIFIHSISVSSPCQNVPIERPCSETRQTDRIFTFHEKLAESEADDQKAGYFGNVNQQASAKNEHREILFGAARSLLLLT
jgi:palmitoyl-protein thioesterase